MNTQQIILCAEIRDEYGDVESATNASTLAEVVRFYSEHGIDFSQVTDSESQTRTLYTYTRKP